MNIFASSYQALVSKGQKAALSDRQPEAEALFLEAIGKDPARALAYGCLGLLYQSLAGRSTSDSERHNLGQASVESFDQAIRLEASPSIKAEFFWQRAVALGLLGKPQDQDQSLQNADRVIAGFTARRDPASEWRKQRSCKKCGRPFTLSEDHNGEAPVWIAAESLEAGGQYNSVGNYFALDACNNCYKDIMMEVLESAMRDATSTKR